MTAIEPEHMTASAEHSQIDEAVVCLFPALDVVAVGRLECEGAMAADTCTAIALPHDAPEFLPDFTRGPCRGIMRSSDE